MTTRLDTRTALLGGCLLFALPASAADKPQPIDEAKRTGGPVQLEDPPSDPHIIPEQTLRSPQKIASFGSFTAMQVNVDDNGLNILNDAANEPSIAVDPTAPNRMAIGWRQFDNIASNFRQAGYSWSVDGGRTWAGQQVIEPGIFRSDPVLAADANGTFYYLSLSTPGGTFICDMFTSTDGGKTWPNKSFAVGGDKTWYAIDNTGSDSQNFIYQAWNTAGNQYFPAQFSRSTDGGENWIDPVEYDTQGIPPARPVFGQVAVGPDGAVYVAGPINSVSTDVFWLVKSDLVQFPGFVPNFNVITSIDFGGNSALGTGPNPQGLLGQVEVAVDSSGGPNHNNVYLVGSIDPPGNDPMDIHFLKSTDGGVTFGQPVRINDDVNSGNGLQGLGEAWQWFGTMGLAPNGRIDVVWLDHRLSATDNIAQLFYAFSTDGGETWSKNTPVSEQFDTHLGWPNQNKMGDYFEVVSDNLGANVAWVATFNGEQDVYYLRIGDYDCNQNNIGDSTELAEGAVEDCNENGIPDSCEIAAGAVADADMDGIPDNCGPCIGDISGDGIVDSVDLLALLGTWGVCPGCPADLNGDNVVATTDLLILLAAWGDC